jgi:hypothetical protein
VFALDGVPEEEPLHVELFGKQFLGQVRYSCHTAAIGFTAAAAVAAVVLPLAAALQVYCKPLGSLYIAQTRTAVT